MDRDIVLPEPLGHLAWSQVQRALDVFDLGTLEDVSPTTTGGFNYNQHAFLRTSAGEFVLKGAPRTDWQFPKERFFAELITNRTTINCPWPYHFHPEPGIFDWPFVIMPRLAGSELHTLLPAEERTPEDWHAIARAQAIALAELQAAIFDYAGDFSLATGGLEPYPGSHADWVINEITTQLARSPALSEEEARWVVDQARALGSSLDDDGPNVIVHGDFGYWNMLFERVGQEFQVIGVFDWLTATIGDPLADVAYQYAKYLEADRSAADEFVTTYLKHHGRRESSIEERLRLYILYERLNIRDFAHGNGTDWIDWTVPLQEWLSFYSVTDNLSWYDSPARST